jgi:septal ring factor EnvC (AmiA/AmiB activator)
MIEVTNQLIYEVLKQIQADMAQVKATQGDHTRQFLRMREDINNVRDDINNLRADDIRLETLQTQIVARLERIENRLNLTDA